MEYRVCLSNKDRATEFQVVGEKNTAKGAFLSEKSRFSGLRATNRARGLSKRLPELSTVLPNKACFVNAFSREESTTKVEEWGLFDTAEWAP